MAGLLRALAITVNRDIFTALTLVQHRLVVVKSNRPPNCKATAMDRTRNGTACIGLAPKRVTSVAAPVLPYDTRQLAA
jgi:hypothetical protein